MDFLELFNRKLLIELGAFDVDRSQTATRLLYVVLCFCISRSVFVVDIVCMWL
jgi:hypothetical protein